MCRPPVSMSSDQHRALVLRVFTCEGIVAACITAEVVLTTEQFQEGQSDGLVFVVMALAIMRTCVCALAQMVHEDVLYGKLPAIFFGILPFQGGAYISMIHLLAIADAVDTSSIVTLVGLTVTNVALSIDAIWIFLPVTVRTNFRSEAHISGDPASKQAPPDADELIRLLSRRSLIIVEADARELLCSICMLDIEGGAEVTELKCGHIFHCSCIQTWIRTSRCGCPMRCQPQALTLQCV